MKVGIYIRVSTKEQINNSSLGFQKSLGIEVCKRFGYTNEIFQEARSGGSVETRLEYKRLIRAIEDGTIGGIWVYDNDRLNRNLQDGLDLSDIIKKHKVKLIVGWEEKLIDTTSGRLEYLFKNVISDYERYKIRDRMNFGKQNLIRNGGKMGNVGLGFKRAKGLILVDDKEANVVKKIFKIYNYKNVNSYGEVFNRINNDNKKKGLEFKLSASTIGRVLKDKKYNGLYEGSVKIEETIEPYKIDLEKIIDDDLFSQTQNKIKRTKGVNRGNVKNDYELKGKVYCGNCGEQMWVVKNGRYVYYSCAYKMKNIREKRKNSNVRFDCISKVNTSNKIAIKKLESIIWDGLFKVLDNSKDYHDEYIKRFDKSKEGKSRIKHQLKTLRIRKSNKEGILKDKLRVLLEQDIDLSIINSLRDDYKLEINKIEKDIKIFELDELKSNKLEEVGGYLELLKNDLKNDYKSASIKTRRGIIEKYINSISIRRDKKGDFEYRIELELHLRNIGKYNNEMLVLDKGSNDCILKVRPLEVCSLILKFIYLVKRDGSIEMSIR